MARATGSTKTGSSVSLQLFVGDDVSLAEQTRRHAPELDLVAEGGCADAEFSGETAERIDG